MVELGKGLTSDATSIPLSCDGREVVLKTKNPKEQLKDARWVIFVASGFQTEEEARVFGRRLRAKVELAALSARVGVDTGQDQQTAWINQDWLKSQGYISEDVRIAPSVHGLSVLPDDKDHVTVSMGASLSTTVAPQNILGAISELSEAGLTNLGDCTAGVRLLNFALMTSEALAQAVLAFAAVEALGQDEKWSKRQKARIEELALEVEEEATGEGIELLEVAEALRRNLHRIGLRQGVMRVLERLSLGHLKKEWDRLYEIRSGIFHGTKTLSASEANKFSQEALELCAEIVIANLRARGHHIPEIFEKAFASG